MCWVSSESLLSFKFIPKKSGMSIQLPEGASVQEQATHSPLFKGNFSILSQETSASLSIQEKTPNKIKKINWHHLE